jgi:hypothetical protein
LGRGQIVLDEQVTMLEKIGDFLLQTLVAAERPWKAGLA